MVERINGKTILTTPISAEDLEGIKIGDIVYLNGSMTTCRDEENFRLMSETMQFSMQDQSSVRLKTTSLRWFLSDRLPPCVWRNSSMNL